MSFDKPWKLSQLRNTNSWQNKNDSRKNPDKEFLSLQIINF